MRRVPRRAPRRALIIYVLAIVGPTLVLLYLGLAAVQRQRDAIVRLTTFTERLRLERAAEAVQRRAADAARAFLLDRQLGAALRDVDWLVPESAHAARRALDVACDAHPVCADVIVVGRSDRGLPLLDEPLPRDLAAMLPGERSLATIARELLVVAEQAELAGAANDALRLYEKVAALEAAASIRALALARVARVHLQRGQIDAAARAWTRVLTEHPDAYDLSGRPLAVIATLELARLPAMTPATTPMHTRSILSSVGRDLARVRWNVSPGQAEYFAAQIDGAAGARESWSGSRLFTQFDLARRVREHLAAFGGAAAQTISAVALGEMTPPHQLFHVRLEPEDGPPMVIAMDVDLQWVRDDLLPAVARDTPSALPRTEVRLVSPSAAATVFHGTFPFWGLSPGPSAPVVSRWWRSELLAFGGSVGGVLAVLVLGVVLLMRDVARDAATSRLRSDLVSGVSHELKTPLSVIRLYAESLADDVADPDARMAHGRVILHESERLSHLVQRVLEFSRLEETSPSYTLDVHAPVVLVETFVAHYGPYLAHLGFTTTAEYSSQVPEIRVDAGALTQALVNLVDNAVKYSGDARTLVLRVLERSPGRVAIEVEDRGVGILPPERRHVLEPFYRGNRTMERGGYGLGLYLVSQIMQVHGGDIEIDTPAAGGTCVRLVFPAATCTEES